MTTLYFVRHSKVNYTKEESIRALSEAGKKDVYKVTAFFRDVHIDKIVSSPYIRAIDTIRGVAEEKQLAINLIDDLRERKVSDSFIDDFDTFAKRQWADDHFKLEGGESFAEVRERGGAVIADILERDRDKSIIIGTHGTFLGIQLNHYDAKYDYAFWQTIKMPDIFKLAFDEKRLLSIKNERL